MDLRQQLLQEHSKQNTQLIIDWIGNHPERFAKLMEIFLNDEYRVVQRSAWVVGICGLEHPEWIKPYIREMLDKCTEAGIHVAVKRNVLRVLADFDIPEEHHESALNLCFDRLCDSKETIAVRCFAMSTIAGLCKHYPEIKGELVQTLEYALAHEELSAGFKARSKAVLKQLNKKAVR